MRKNNEFYDETELLTKKDLAGKEPDIYLIESNRSDGKTTKILRRGLNCYKRGEQFGLIYRYQYELKCAHEIFAKALELEKMNDYIMESVPHANGLFYEILIGKIDENGKVPEKTTFGYAFGLNNPDSLKKYSPLFENITEMLFDEFQTESGKYLPKESDKLLSVLTTIARGGGQHARKIKLFMCANKVSLMNPYYISFGIYKRKKADTHFLRGNGWVAEFNFNPHASEAIKDTGFARAFSDSDYVQYATEDVYLHESEMFIEKPSGKSSYICSILHASDWYGVREFPEIGILYISNKIDSSCLTKITFKANDHNQNTIMLNKYCFIWKRIRDAFQGGYLRFDDLKTKNAIFEILAVDIYK